METLSIRDERTTDPVAGLELLAGQPWPAGQAVFQDKLRPAANPHRLLPRPRLHALLDELVSAPLTLVVAPAGSGKTSLLRSWAAETRVPLAWLSLDDQDRDAVHLWRAVLAALERIAPGCSIVAADLLGRPDGLPAAVSALLEDLEARDLDPTLLVIDDLQLVDDEDAAASSLAVFVQHLPVWLHVVVASRRAPRLPVHRLRARGLLGEVHFRELRFSVDEAAAMLSRLAPSLEAGVVAEVAERADGWAASLQLAALAARSALVQGQPYLPDHHDDLIYLEDYVWQEILADESQEIVDVLMATAVVQLVDIDLARVLASRPDAPDLLAHAEERGLFVFRVEPAGFELHPLVRAVLLAGLANRAPDRLSRLHTFAAGWYETQGRTVSALEHWLLADRPRDALRLLADQALALYDDGRENTILDTVRAMPESVATDGLDAMTEYAWSHLLVDRNRFVDLVDGLVRSVRDDVDVDPVRCARVELLQSISATLRGHWVEGGSLARSALQQFGDTWWLDPIGQCAWNIVARDLALSEQWDDAGHESREVVRALGVAPERRLAFEASRALAEALAGRPVDALRLAAGIRAASDVSNKTIARTEILTAEAIAHRELGDAAVALPLLVELSTERVEATPHCQLLALLELARVHVDANDHDEASRVFDMAAELVDHEMPGPGARTWLAAKGTVLSLSTGDVDGARAWSAQARDPFWSAICAARVLLATDQAEQAAVALEAAEPRCLRHQVLLDVLQFRAFGAPDEADQHLFEAVRLAAGHGLVQTLASEGRGVVEAIEKLAWQAEPAWLDRLRRAGQPEDLASRVDRSSGPVEVLTERELAVLRMLPSRLTLREIADELFISINTLKFHLKVIYRKLGCSSRAEAADMARALAGLHRPAQAVQPWSTRRRWTS